MNDYELANYDGIKDLKEIDFYDDDEKKQLNREFSKIIDEKYFSRLKKVNNLNELAYFVICENGTIPKEIGFDKKMYDKLEKVVSQIIVNQGLIEYNKLIDGEIEFAEDIKYKPALAYILNEGILDKEEIKQIKFKTNIQNFNSKKYVNKYLVNNFVDKVCEFFEEPGSFTLDENMIPKEFYN